MSTRAPGRVVLLDSYGLIYRAFHALPLLTTKTGVYINAVYGFTMMLGRIIADEKPKYIVAAFDKGPPHERIAMFPQYKAQRETTPDELRSQFALVRRVLETYGIPIVEMAGEEADDVIATLAAKVEGEHDVRVVTGDLDLLQIVDEKTTIVATRRSVTDLAYYDPAAVRERYGLEPSQLADYRGLKGDPSDNLPGVPGIGEKTASKFISIAGSLDALLANPELAGSARFEALLREHGDMARVCRDVSRIKRDLPVEMPWDESLYVPPTPEILAPLYRELEFKTLLAKLELDTPLQPTAHDTITGAYDTFEAVTDPPDFLRLAERIASFSAHRRLAFAMLGDAIGISHAPETALSFGAAALEIPKVRAAVEMLVTSVTEFVAHDAKRFFRVTKIAPRSVTDDTMVGAYLLVPTRSYAEISDAVVDILQLSLPRSAAAAADAAFRMAEPIRRQIAERNQTSLYDDLELPLVTLLARMEACGFAVDLTELTRLQVEVDEKVARLRGEIFELGGEEFNLESPKQLGVVLFEKLGLPGGKKNKTGYSTGVEVLAALASDYPIAARILEYREVAKLKSTYIDVIPTLTERDGRLRTIFNQTTTTTGRLSSTNPNLQNIPVRGEIGRRIRKSFVAGGAERRLLSADYSQIELRLMAHLSGDAALKTAFAENRDIHDVTARKIFGVADDASVDDNQRRIAKSVNFGLLYGMSEFGLAQRLHLDRAEARLMIETYFAQFPHVRGYLEKTVDIARETGYVETLLGRRRYLPDLRARDYQARSSAEREAVNAPLQGGAADLMKLAMLRVANRLHDADALMLLQIHDEIVLEVAASQLPTIAGIVRREMETALELSVPLTVTVKSGTTWYDVAAYSDDELIADI